MTTSTIAAVATPAAGTARHAASADVDFFALQRALAGQFSLERLLGRGGMGTVYLGREVELDREVAIKVLPPALAAQAEVRERFLREARTAARLSHPNIVPVHRVDELDGFVFFVMAYVDGPTLEAEVRRRGALPPAEVARVVRDVGWALAYAHARGVVHRDVKPENILLDRATGRALVTDFGIAQVAGSAAGTPPGMVIGTPYFMSPEHAQGKPVDGRSDLYSLAVVAFYALTGQLPFTGLPEAVLVKQVTQAPPPLLALNPSVAAGLAETVQRGLAKSPDDRYPNAEAFADAVARSLVHSDTPPLPLALWVAAGAEVRYVLAAVLGLMGLAVADRVHWGEWAGFALATTGWLMFVELREVRRLLAMGYQLDDLRRALCGSGAPTGHAPVGLARLAGPRQARSGLDLDSALGAHHRALARSLSVVVAGLAALASAAALLRPSVARPEPLGLALVVAAALLARGWRERGWGRAWRTRLWGGHAGRVLARVAGWRLRSADPDRRVVPWPAEVLLGRATQDLFATLPAAAREELQRLPEAVERLERAARVLRQRIDELSGALATLGDGRGPQPNADSASGASRRAQAADVRAERDAAGRQLASVVSALEHIRLEALRLQSDASDVRRLAVMLDAVEPVPETR